MSHRCQTLHAWAIGAALILPIVAASWPSADGMHTLAKVAACLCRRPASKVEHVFKDLQFIESSCTHVCGRHALPLQAMAMWLQLLPAAGTFTVRNRAPICCTLESQGACWLTETLVLAAKLALAGLSLKLQLVVGLMK